MTQVIRIPSLTGLRFFAAFFVFFSHLLPKIMPFPSHPPNWYQQLGSLSGEGMTLFFVLSGFVIHYNYSGVLEKDGVRGLYNFFVARFVRLYPLYIVMIAYQLLFSFSYSALPLKTFDILPSYLLMTQTWFYWPVGKYGLVYELGVLPPLAWSISTEWFFYLAYPVVRIVLKRLPKIRDRLCFAVIIGIIICTAVATAGHNNTALDQFGVDNFGVASEVATRSQYTFARWLVYFSPYSRIFEFILGCICASIFLSVRNQKPSDREERLGQAVLLGTIIALAVFHWAMWGSGSSPGPLSILPHFSDSFGFAPFMAIIIFCCSRYQNLISRTLSSWTLVTCGEASYSLYLWHMWIVMAVRWEAAPVTSFIVGVGNLLRMTVAIMAAIGLSLVSWRVIEVPARNWLKNLLTIKSKTNHPLKYAVNPVEQINDLSLVRPKD